jgi:hypothetical protein
MAGIDVAARVVMSDNCIGIGVWVGLIKPWNINKVRLVVRLHIV